MAKKRTASDKAKEQIKKGYQVKEDKPIKAKKNEAKPQKSSKTDKLKPTKGIVKNPSKKSENKKNTAKRNATKKNSNPAKKPKTKKPLERERKNKIGKPGANIKWRDKDNENLRKAVKRVNSKVTRLNKKGYDLTKVSVKSLKHDLRTREEFNQFMKDVDAFTEYNSEKKQRKSHIWNYEKTYASLRHRRVEEHKEDLLNKYHNEMIYDRGKKLGIRKDRKGSGNNFIDETMAALKPSTLDYSSRSKFKRSMNRIDNNLDEARTKFKNMQYKDNYYEAAKNYVGDEDILAIIRMLSPEDLADLARTDVNGDIQYLYTNDDMMKYKLMRMFQRYTPKIREEYMRGMKKKGVPKDTLEKMENLSDARFSKVMFSYERVEMIDPFGEPHVEYNYNRTEDVNEVINRVNRYKR